MGNNPGAIPADWGAENNTQNTPILIQKPKYTPIEQDKVLSFGEYSLGIDEVYRDIKRLTLSKNPLDLLFKANEIREKFAFFINSLAGFISQSFSSFDDDSFINELYHDSKYHYVWMELAYPFLRDAHFCTERFDNLTYTKKDDFGNEQTYPIDTKSLLLRYEKNIHSADDFLAVKAFIQVIISTYSEYKAISKRWERDNISCAIDTAFEQRNLHTICRERIFDAKTRVQEIVAHFPYEKELFKNQLEDIFESCNLSHQDREELRIFAFKEVADAHYGDIQYIFFDTNLPFIKDHQGEQEKQFLSKHEWLRLKGMQELTIDTIGTEKEEEGIKAKNQEYFRHILNFKELVLELEGNILSPILLPVILKLVASAMTLDKKEFYKFSYILLFLFANSYENEYIPLSRFLNELEVYINYNNKPRLIQKLKIGFSLVLLFGFFTLLGYFLLPPMVYIPGVVLVGLYLKMYFIDDYTYNAGIRYNLGTKLWSTLLLVVFGYVWISNIGLYADYYSGLQKKLEGFGNHIVAEIIPPEQIGQGIKNASASILDWNKKR